MATYQQYLVRFPKSSQDPAFTVNDGGGADSISIPAGYYYLRGYTGETSLQLMEKITELLDAEISGATATFSYSTGKVTLDFNSTTTSVSWDDTDLRDALGFTANLSGASTYVATYKARYVWSPSLPPSSFSTSLSSFWAIEPRSKTYRANDGSLSAVRLNDLYYNTIMYDSLPVADILTDECDLQDSFEQFYSDAAARPIRVYKDRTLNTAANIELASIAMTDDSHSQITDMLDRSVSEYQGLWNVTLQLWKEVGTDDSGAAAS